MSRRKITYNPKLDFYELLGVNTSASREEIQRIYRQKAKLLHPDVNPERREWATEQFQHLNEAYDVLSDTDLRRQYDEMRWPYILPKSAPRPHHNSNSNTKSWTAEDRWWEQPKKTRSTFDPFYTPPPRRQAGAWLERYGLKIVRPYYAALVDLFNSPYRYVLNLLGLMIGSVIVFQLLVMAGAIELRVPEGESDNRTLPTQVVAVSNTLIPTQVPPTPNPTIGSHTTILNTCKADILIDIQSIEMVGVVLQIKVNYHIPNGDTIQQGQTVTLASVRTLGDNRIEIINPENIVDTNIDLILNSASSLKADTSLEKELVTSTLAAGIYRLRWTPILADGSAHAPCDQLIQISAP